MDGGRACSHVVASEDVQFRVRFTGRGRERDLVCEECGDVPRDELVAWDEARITGREALLFEIVGIVGAPEVLSRPSGLRFVSREIVAEGLPGGERAVTACPGGWLVVGEGRLVRVRVREDVVSEDVPKRVVSEDVVALVEDVCVVPEDVPGPWTVVASPCGRFAAVATRKGRYGVVVDLGTGGETTRLDRGEYHEDVCEFSVAFFRHDGRTYLVHATDWNRLDLSDPSTGELLTPRSTRWERGEERPAHYLDYFHCGLTVSPDGRWLVDDGWVWHPVGIVRAFDLRAWLGNVWESEDGASVRELRVAEYRWDGPRCFVGDVTLAVWGYGNDDQALLDAVLLYDVRTGERTGWFAGPPQGALAYDVHLLAWAPGHGTSVWDVATGERLHEDAGLVPDAHDAIRRRLITLGDGRIVERWLVG